jgi:peptide/nickel transport system permease protein
MHVSLRTAMSTLWHLAFVLLGVSVLTFALLNVLPGDPAQTILGSGAPPEAVEQLSADLGLDEPVIQRFGSWLGDALQADLGQSARSERAVAPMIAERLPPTVELITLALVLAVALAIPTAVLSARRPGGLIDRVFGATAFAALSVPTFLVGVVLILVFAVRLGWLPATGYVGLDQPVEHIRAMILPALTLALGQFAIAQRVVRSEMIDTLGEPFVDAARARGVGESRVLRHHVLRNSLVGIVTLLGLQVGALIGGTVIVENLFGIPGVGRLLIDSIQARDVNVVQGIVLVSATVYVVSGVLTDTAQRRLDPRSAESSPA